MTKTKKGRRAYVQHRKNKGSSSPKPKTNNFEDKLTRARELEEAGQPESAIPIYENLIALKPENHTVHEEVAEIFMGNGNAEKAEKHFRAAIKLCPDDGFEKYAYLAQIIGNTEEALSFAQKGVEIIEMKASNLNQLNTNDVKSSDGMDKDDLEEQKTELREYEASAHCAVAEIALGIIEDSNDPSVAAKMDVLVEQSIMSALAVSKTGSNCEIEATLTLANLRLSQGKKDEARNAMTRVFECISEALNELDQDSNRTDEQVIVGALQKLPSMEVRIAIGKQLMEVGLWMGAIHVLSSILWECDFNVEVWYMLSVAYWKESDIDEARHALESARKVLHSPEGYDGTLDEELIDKLLKKLDCNSDAPHENDGDTQMKD